MAGGAGGFSTPGPAGLDLPRGGTEYPPSGTQGVLPPMEEVVRNQIREFLAGKGLRKTSQRGRHH